MLSRPYYLEAIAQNLAQFRVCALLGPRQCGKTTLVKQYMEGLKQAGQPFHFFDLEDPDDLNALTNPKLVFERLEGLIIIDEIQRIPELFPIIRVLVDHNQKKFLILGSASQDLIRQSSEALTGRIVYTEVSPFAAWEVGDNPKLHFRGGFPLAFLENSDQAAQRWLKAYTQSYLERDLPSLGIDINSVLMRRFWQMLCNYHGQTFNASELGKALDLSHKTTRKYLDVLVGTFMIRTLQPWYENIAKRQVKQPKVYFRDSGVFHNLLGVQSYEELLRNAKLGASWEGYALEQVIAYYKAEPHECFFWASHGGAEIDLLIRKGTTFQAFEFKFTSTPKATLSMHSALKTLGLDLITVVVPSDVDYPLTETIHVKGLARITST